MVSDSIGDFIIRIKNAGIVKHESVEAPYSKLRLAVAQKLVSTGYLEDVQEIGEGAKKKLQLSLQYNDTGAHRVNGVKRISKPGRRTYAKAADLHPVKFGKGHMIMSTSAGILTGEEARAQNMGGEQLFIIW